MNIIDNIPDIDTSCIYESAKYEGTKILFNAIEYDLFSRLEDPKHYQALSEEIDTDPELTKKFLNVLTSLDLLQKTGERYRNTRYSDTFFVKESPFYQGNLLRMRMRNDKDWRKIGEALKKGGIRHERKMEDYIDRVFIDGHAESAMCGPLQKAVRIISGLPEFSRARNILDLGGGHGLYAMAFAQLNPDMDISLFDLPHVTAMAEENFKRYDMAGRIKTIAGDFTKHDIGSGYDIIFASDITADGILEKIKNALAPGGIFIYRRWTINDDRISPLKSVLFDFSLAMARSEHRLYTLNEYIEMLRKASLRVIKVLDLATEEDPTKLIITGKQE